MHHKAEIVDLRFDLYGTRPTYLTVGGQQSLWVSCAGTAEVTGLFRDGTIEKYPVDGVPQQIALGGESIWFTMPEIDAVGRIDHDGNIQNYRMPQWSRPQGIVATEDAAWVTLGGTGALARVAIGGAIEVVQPVVMGDDELEKPPPAEPGFIAMDDRGSLWFTRQGRGDIVRMDADRTTESWIEEDCALPSAIAVDRDAVWIADANEAGIWRIGRSEKLLQRVEPWLSGPAAGVASDRMGGCWVTETGENLVGHIDADVKLTEYSLESYGEKPRGIAVDRDGVVWVALQTGGIVGVVEPLGGGSR